MPALTLLHPKVSVPLPIGQNRNAVVMALIEGPNLAKCRLSDPRATLDDILANVRAAYQAGVIHADLSEYNILLENGKCVIIDWPQWMETTHPNAGRHPRTRYQQYPCILCAEVQTGV